MPQTVILDAFHAQTSCIIRRTRVPQSSSLMPQSRIGLPGKADRAALEALRGQFIADPHHTDLSVLRPVIARSWRRSALCQVSTARGVMEAITDPHIDEQFLRCAEPVLAELEQLCRDTDGCVSLSDPVGTMAVFRGEPAMVRWAAKTFPTLGGCMSEDVVGTNSDGTAIEEGRAVQVWGGEHYNEALQETYCTSVPIHDPLRRSIRGVLSLTLPERVVMGVDPRSILVIVQGAAAEITRSLVARLAAREQSLLTEYLREIRKRGADAVIAMDEQTTIANRGATQMLDQSDFAVLAAYARDAAQLDRPAEFEVRNARDERIQAQIRPVTADDAPAGSVMRLRKVGGILPGPARALRGSVPESQFAEMVGQSLGFRRAIEAAGTAGRHAMPAYIVGEPGTGKRHLGEILVRLLADRCTIHHCSDLEGDLDPIISDLGSDAAVLLHHVDALAGADRDRLIEMLGRVERPRLVVTMDRLTDDLLPLVSALHGVEISMPPLRTRREDVPLLVAAFQHASGSPRRVSAKLIELLAGAEWPGNVRQLKEVVEGAALQATGREISTDDLSLPHRRALARSRLSRLQTAELEQISDALVEAGGNRLRAAAILRIGRSTLYRKIDFYTSRGFDLERKC